MRYWMNIILLLSLFGTALMTYFIKYRTREMELELRRTRVLIQKREDEITVLRGELSYRSRPEQLEKLSRHFLKLRPVDRKQIVTLEDFQPAKREGVSQGNVPHVELIKPSRVKIQPSGALVTHVRQPRRTFRQKPQQPSIESLLEGILQSSPGGSR